MTGALANCRGGLLSDLVVQRTGVSTSNEADGRHTLTRAEKPLRFDLHFANGERIGVKLYGSGNEPSTLWKLLSTFHQLAQLPPGWDSYSAQPLNSITVKRSLNLFPLLLSDEIPDPTLVPTADGGVQFEWHRFGVDVEIKVPPSGPVSYAITDLETGEEREAEGTLDIDLILGVLNREIVVR